MALICSPRCEATVARASAPSRAIASQIRIRNIFGMGCVMTDDIVANPSPRRNRQERLRVNVGASAPARAASSAPRTHEWERSRLHPDRTIMDYLMVILVFRLQATRAKDIDWQRRFRFRHGNPG